jgi:hypothetical protein
MLTYADIGVLEAARADDIEQVVKLTHAAVCR